MGGGDLRGTGQLHARHHLLEAQGDQQRDEQEQAAELRTPLPRSQTERARIRHGRHRHARIPRALLIRAARQFGESVGGEDLPDGRRA